MENIKTVFGSNLAALRTAAGMTQAELAEQLNYSDKAVSKWERGESIPDATTLKRVGELFSVSMDELLTDPDELKAQRETVYAKVPTEEEKKETRTKHRLIEGIVQSSVWLLAILVIIVLWIFLKTIYWQVLVFMFPVSCLLAIIFTGIWGEHISIRNAFNVALFIVGLISVIYVIFRKYDPWQLYLIMIPTIVVIGFSFRLYSFKEKKKDDPEYQRQKAEKKAEKKRRHQEKKLQKEMKKQEKKQEKEEGNDE